MADVKKPIVPKELSDIVNEAKSGFTALEVAIEYFWKAREHDERRAIAAATEQLQAELESKRRQLDRQKIQLDESNRENDELKRRISTELADAKKLLGRAEQLHEENQTLNEEVSCFHARVNQKQEVIKEMEQKVDRLKTDQAKQVELVAELEDRLRQKRDQVDMLSRQLSEKDDLLKQEHKELERVRDEALKGTRLRSRSRGPHRPAAEAASSNAASEDWRSAAPWRSAENGRGSDSNGAALVSRETVGARGGDRLQLRDRQGSPARVRLRRAGSRDRAGGAASSEAQPDFCLAHLFGTCSRGSACRSRHLQGQEFDAAQRTIMSTPCKFGKTCEREDCGYKHGDTDRSNRSTARCPNGRQCRRPACFFVHPGGRIMDKESRES